MRTVDVSGLKGENGDDEVKERDRIGENERPKRRHSIAVHDELTRRAKGTVTNSSLSYIPQEDEHGHEIKTMPTGR